MKPTQSKQYILSVLCSLFIAPFFVTLVAAESTQDSPPASGLTTPAPVDNSASTPSQGNYPLGGGVVLKTGWQSIHLPELPTPEKKPSWFPYGFKPEEEEFCVYVPSSYDPAKPCGIFGWTNQDDGLVIPQQFTDLFEKYRLIAVSAAKCGNYQSGPRRAGLLTSAALELQKCFTFDPHLRILCGASHSGEIATLGCFEQPDVWSASITWSLCCFYQDFPMSGSEKVWSGLNRVFGGPDDVKAQNVSTAKKNGRFVIIVGDQDQQNILTMRDTYAAFKKAHFQALLIEEAGLGHAAIGSTENLQKALDFIVAESPPDSQ